MILKYSMLTHKNKYKIYIKVCLQTHVLQIASNFVGWRTSVKSDFLIMATMVNRNM
jgi:hypothetical protein